MATPTPTEQSVLLMTVKEPVTHPEHTDDDLLACTPDHIDTMSVDQLKQSLREAIKQTQRQGLTIQELRSDRQRLCMHIKGTEKLHELQMNNMIEHLALARRAHAQVSTTPKPLQGGSDGSTGPDSTATAIMPVPQLPVFFKDCLGRDFKFPYERCRSWRDMQALMRAALDRVDSMGSIVDLERFDLVGPDGETIVAEYYEDVIYPGMQLKMVSWFEDKIRSLRSRLADGSDDEHSGEEPYSDEEYYHVDEGNDLDDPRQAKRAVPRNRSRSPSMSRTRSPSPRPGSPPRGKEYSRNEEKYELVERDDCSCDECQPPKRPQRNAKKARNVGKAKDRR